MADSISPEASAVTSPTARTTPVANVSPAENSSSIVVEASDTSTETTPPKPEEPEPFAPPVRNNASESNDATPLLALPAPKRSKKMWLWAGIVIVVLAILAGGAFALYKFAHNRGYDQGKKDGQSPASAAADIKVPANATIISQCTEGEGTQYVLPSDIPHGPIYNMWHDKVTGIEYMVGQDELMKAAAIDLSLYGGKMNHLDIMYEEAGHAGFTEPHYHLIVSLISYADEKKITCGNGSSSDSSMSHMNM